MSPEASEVIDSLSGTTSVETLDVVSPEPPELPPELPVEPEAEALVPPPIPYVAAAVSDVAPLPSALRQVHTHKINGLNEKLDIDVLAEPGEGGASQRYRVVNKDTQQVMCDLQFQVGNPNEIGVNGISNEVLLAIVADRLEGFQSGRFRSDFGELALNKLNQCMRSLRRRTQERVARGVEGTLQR